MAILELHVFRCSSIANNKPNRAGYNKAWDFYRWNKYVLIAMIDLFFPNILLLYCYIIVSRARLLNCHQMVALLKTLLLWWRK